MKEIQLTQGKVALVDDEDFDRVNQFKWCARRSNKIFYVLRNVLQPDGAYKSQLLHQFLMPGVSQIDHRNGDGLDNQKSNLRPASHSQNIANSRKSSGCSSKFKGVHWDNIRSLWAAQIRINWAKLNLGRYESEEDAAHVYDYAAKIYFGEFARLNFPE